MQAWTPKRRLVFDLESDGLLDEVSKVHVLVIRDITNNETHTFRRNALQDTIAEGVQMLADPHTQVIAHNGTKYDLPVLRKLYGLEVPWWRTLDTLVLARLIWPNQFDRDIAQSRAAKSKREYTPPPPGMLGSHSLEAWGHRLGKHKGDYQGDPAIADPAERFARRWERWNQSMEDYCVQDVRVTVALLRLIEAQEYPMEPVMTEMQVAHILARQERHGFLFDQIKAAKLYAKLAQRKLELERDVRRVFLPRFLKQGPVFIPKRDNQASGYSEGAPVQKIKLTEFNPGSRAHVALWLRMEYGWEPTEFTDSGEPKIDDDVISKLPYPEAAPLKEYFMVCKRLGQLAEGNEAWLKAVRPDGRIHGSVNTIGAITYRMTHSGPNMAQVPSGKSPYGHECRELFIVPSDKLLVGADADALELRDLAGYMAIYDGGAYIKTVLEGDKAQGTDMHSVNCRALGMDPKAKVHGEESGRDIAKTWFYAFIYGGGDEKLGYILIREWGDRAREVGKKARESFLRNLPAMGSLVQAVQRKAKKNGFLKGLDGRRLYIRSNHAALNTLLQSAGAIQMKKALCILDDSLQARGWVPGVHYEFVANVHDEWQIEVNHDIAEEVGRMAVEAIRQAGIHFGFRCPLDGAFDVGRSWAETH
ncbi:MAG: DNA polymerase [Aquabacterium sp.]